MGACPLKLGVLRSLTLFYGLARKKSQDISFDSRYHSRMDSNSRAEVPDVAEGQWVELGYTTFTGPITNPIKRPIHPLLRRYDDETRQPRSPIDKWRFKGSLSEKRASRILNPIVLIATKLILSPPNIRYFYGILCNPRRDVVDKYNRPRQSFDLLTDIPFNVLQSVVFEALKRLAPKISYVILESTHPCMKTSHAFCTINWSCISMVSIFKDDEVSGVASVIFLNEGMLTMIEDLKDRPGDHTDQILNAQFTAAESIRDELTHALGKAVRPELYSQALSQSLGDEQNIMPTPEPYLADEEVNELGHSSANHIYGGAIDSGYAEPGLIRVCYFPCTLYEEFSRGTDRNGLEHFVPMSFIRKIHERNFWKPIDPEDPKALYIRRIVLFS